MIRRLSTEVPHMDSKLREIGLGISPGFRVYGFGGVRGAGVQPKTDRALDQPQPATVEKFANSNR